LKVEFVEPDFGFDAILQDPAFEVLISEVLTDQAALLFAAEVIKQYLTSDALAGKTTPHVSVEKFAHVFWARSRHRG
jgi:hypothetical protein